MNYTEKIETTQAQQAPTLLQDLQKLPPFAFVLTIIAGMTAVGVLPLWPAVILAVLIWWGISTMRRNAELKEAKAKAATYANCIGPVIVSSIHPNETVEQVEQRATEWRECLRLSGNPYAERIPIIPMPYNVILTDYGQLTAGWSTYQRQVGERAHVENLKWYEGKCPNELKSLFASAVLPAPKFETV